MNKTTTLIYVKEIGCPHDISWYPVDAVHEHGDCYRIVSRNPDPEHIYWEFSNNDVVSCETYKFAEGEFGLVARSKCNNT